jgi:hypothetical protein
MLTDIKNAFMITGNIFTKLFKEKAHWLPSFQLLVFKLSSVKLEDNLQQATVS